VLAAIDRAASEDDPSASFAAITSKLLGAEGVKEAVGRAIMNIISGPAASNTDDAGVHSRGEPRARRRSMLQADPATLSSKFPAAAVLAAIDRAASEDNPSASFGVIEPIISNLLGVEGVKEAAGRAIMNAISGPATSNTDDAEAHSRGEAHARRRSMSQADPAILSSKSPAAAVLAAIASAASEEYSSAGFGIIKPIISNLLGVMGVEEAAGRAIMNVVAGHVPP